MTAASERAGLRAGCRRALREAEGSGAARKDAALVARPSRNSGESAFLTAPTSARPLVAAGPTRVATRLAQNPRGGEITLGGTSGLPTARHREPGALART